MKPAVRLFVLVLVLIFCTDVYAQQITKKRGTVKVYYPSGKLQSRGKVKNYKRVGEWKYYGEDGYLLRTVNFVNDTVHGKYTEFHPNGKPSSQGNYCMNEKCGNWQAWDAVGAIISDENFVHAQFYGIQRYWYSTGTLRDSIIYDGNGLAYRKQWHPSGLVRAIESYENGLAEGRWLTYSASPVDTFPVTSDQYHLGKKHGWHYAWSGRVLSEAFHYQNGLADGTFTRYDYYGKPTVIHNYVQGKLEGKSTYYTSGKKIKEENYVNDVKDGLSTEFNRDFEITKRIWYKRGSIDSIITYFGEGIVANRDYYPNGTREKVYHKEYNAGGYMMMQGILRNGKRDSVWTTYYPDGKVRSTTTYENGVMRGLFTKYYPNGKKLIQYSFLQDGRNTPPDVWSEKGKLLRMGTPEYNEIVEGNKPGEIINDPILFNRRIIEHTVGDANTETMETGLPDEIEAKLPVKDSADVYSFCEIMPEFPGGEAERNSFITQNFRLTDQMHASEGTVYIEYIVEKDGRVTNVRALRNPSSGVSVEGVRVVSSFPVHTPARQNGEAVRCRLVIPIRINLQK